MIRFNILLIGETSCGKSQFLQRYINDSYIKCTPTVGIDCTCHDVYINNTDIRLLFWDATGNIERFGNIIEDYYKRADGIIIFKNATKSSKSLVFNNWIQLALDKKTPNTQLILVSTKQDLILRQIDNFSIHPIHKLPHIITSAKTGNNIQYSIEQLINLMLDKTHEINIQLQSKNSETIALLPKQKNNSTKCFDCCVIL
tara:strand:+ start:1258 stop:1857 length:600 start_codon:yes stop_codon:yes gene_type:complete